MTTDIYASKGASGLQSTLDGLYATPPTPLPVLRFRTH